MTNVVQFPKKNAPKEDKPVPSHYLVPRDHLIVIKNYIASAKVAIEDGSFSSEEMTLLDAISGYLHNVLRGK